MSLSALDKARIATQERIASGLPVVRLNPFEKLKNNPVSLRHIFRAYFLVFLAHWPILKFEQ